MEEFLPGLFYCPYIPVCFREIPRMVYPKRFSRRKRKMLRAGCKFKSRYAGVKFNANRYFRRFKVSELLG